MKRGSLWSWFWVVLGVLYFFTPLLATLEFSLRSCRPAVFFCGLAYVQVMTDPQFVSTFLFSLEMAVLTILTSLLLILPTAYWVHLRLPQLRPVIEFITLMPFVIPAIVLVFGLIKAYSGGPFHITNYEVGTNALLIGGYMVLSLPYMYRAIDTGMMAIDVRTLTEAAQSLGAGWPTIIIRIIFPNLRAALLSGAFLTLATVIGEFTLATFLVGLKAFGPYLSLIGQNRAYQAASLSLLSFALTWVSMAVIQVFSRGAPGQGPLGGVR
jgi:putative spermidine/putrescine transport system permease protein